ncbi:Vacuolar iron transporter 1 [Linum perenne]
MTAFRRHYIYKQFHALKPHSPLSNTIANQTPPLLSLSFNLPQQWQPTSSPRSKPYSTTTRRSTSPPVRSSATSSSASPTASPYPSPSPPASLAPMPLPPSSSPPASPKSPPAPSPWASEGTYLAARSEADHYSRELKREQEEIIAVPDTEAAEVAEILADYGVQPHEYAPVVNALRKNPQAWLDFMMK